MISETETEIVARPPAPARRFFARSREGDVLGAEVQGFLPDFCNGRTLFHVAVIAEMLAIIVTIVSPQIPVAQTRVAQLALVSLFVQWIALSNAAVLCYARATLNRLPPARAVAAAMLLLLVITYVVGELALLTLWGAKLIESPRPYWNAYFHVQNLTIATIVQALALRYFIARHAQRRSLEAETRARIDVQRARLRPHFLFSTLNVIASLIRVNPPQAEKAVENMADLVRGMLSEDEFLVPVRNELAIAQKYLDIEGLRLDTRLKVDWDVAKYPRAAVMPVLTLQPILEYVIQTCIEPVPEGGRVVARLREEGGRIVTEISAVHPRLRGREAPDTRGLDNLRGRLESHYGDQAHLELRDDAQMLTVSVTLPLRGETT